MSSVSTVEIKICVGTACYVMGASDLLTIEEFLENDELPFLHLEGITCMGLCRAGTNKKPPFITINGEIHDSVDMPTLLKLFRETLTKERINAGLK